MIKEIQAVSLAEVKEILADVETDKAKEIIQFIKRFTKLSAEKAKEMKKEVEALNLFGLKTEDIVKLADLMPEDAEDLRKVFSGSELSLKQDENAKILEIIQKYKKK